MGEEDLLRSRGVAVAVLHGETCIALMRVHRREAGAVEREYRCVSSLYVVGRLQRAAYREALINLSRRLAKISSDSSPILNPFQIADR